MPSFLVPPSQSPRASLGLLAVRVVSGAALLFHGLSKLETGAGSWMEGYGGPGILQTLSPIVPFAETLGGALLVLGLVTPIAALLIAGTMAGAVWFHLSKGDAFVGGYELALVHLSIAFLLLCAGPGSLAMDKALFKKGG